MAATLRVLHGVTRTDEESSLVSYVAQARRFWIGLHLTGLASAAAVVG